MLVVLLLDARILILIAYVGTSSTKIHKYIYLYLNSTFQLVFVHVFDFVPWSWVSPFGGSSGPSFRNQGTGTDPLLALRFRISLLLVKY